MLGEVEIMGPFPTYEISLYGKNDVPLNLADGTTVSVEIGMALLNDLLGENYFNFRYTSKPEFYNAPVAWDRISGVLNVNLEYYDQENYMSIYSGTGNSCINNLYDIAAGNYYQIKINFSFAETSTETLQFDIPPFE